MFTPENVSFGRIRANLTPTNHIRVAVALDFHRSQFPIDRGERNLIVGLIQILAQIGFSVTTGIDRAAEPARDHFVVVLPVLKPSVRGIFVAGKEPRRTKACRIPESGKSMRTCQPRSPVRVS
jgi:hypothetical protein